MMAGKKAPASRTSRWDEEYEQAVNVAGEAISEASEIYLHMKREVGDWQERLDAVIRKRVAGESLTEADVDTLVEQAKKSIEGSAISGKRGRPKGTGYKAERLAVSFAYWALVDSRLKPYRNPESPPRSVCDAIAEALRRSKFKRGFRSYDGVRGHVKGLRRMGREVQATLNRVVQNLRSFEQGVRAFGKGLQAFQQRMPAFEQGVKNFASNLRAAEKGAQATLQRWSDSLSQRVKARDGKKTE
jgi:hypothetical protein